MFRDVRPQVFEAVAHTTMIAPGLPLLWQACSFSVPPEVVKVYDTRPVRYKDPFECDYCGQVLQAGRPVKCRTCGGPNFDNSY